MKINVKVNAHVSILSNLNLKGLSFVSDINENSHFLIYLYIMKTTVLLLFCIILNSQLFSQTQTQHIEDSIRKAKTDFSIKNKIPLCLLEVEIIFNEIGTPVLNLMVQNVSKKSIDAYTIQAYCYDNFNKPVSHYLKSTNVFTGISQEMQAPDRDNYMPERWTLFGYENTTRVKVYLTKVHFYDNTTWSPTDKKITMIKSENFH
jgi:hypothetical protein